MADFEISHSELPVSPGAVPSVSPEWVREHEGCLSPVMELRGKFCHSPFDEAQLNYGARVTFCCPNWLPRSIGKLDEAGLMAIWNSAAAREIRRSILDGSFRYCDKQACPEIQGGSLPEYKDLALEYRDIVDQNKTIMDRPPRLIGFDYDHSCNLSCPSCRTRTITISEGSPQYEELKRLTDLVVKELPGAVADRTLVLNIIGSGDPFVSHVFWDLLRTLDGTLYPKLRIDLQTNGQLFTEENWRLMHKIHRNIRNIFISIDAADPETYSVVRRGGDWNRLMRNLEFLAELRRGNKELSLQLIFVVQQRNFREMPGFVKKFLGKLCDSVKFSFLNDWGTWSGRAEYERQCIWKESHPEFLDFMTVLLDPVFDEPGVLLGNVTAYKGLSLRRALALPLRRRVELYLRTNNSRLFSFSFLCRPAFVLARLRTLRSPGDMFRRVRDLFRLIVYKTLGV